jgi:hypothetical protein
LHTTPADAAASSSTTTTTSANETTVVDDSLSLPTKLDELSFSTTSNGFHESLQVGTTYKSHEDTSSREFEGVPVQNTSNYFAAAIEDRFGIQAAVTKATQNLV